MNTFNEFSKRFNKNDHTICASDLDLHKLEQAFKIYLPDDFKIFANHFGNLWTPDVLDIIVDKKIEMFDVQQFWEINDIFKYKEEGLTPNTPFDIIPFASDCMGNIFAFLSDRIKDKKETSEIYFLDHDFMTLKKLSNSFTEWIDCFNKI